MKYLEKQKKCHCTVIFCQIWSINIYVDLYKLLFQKLYFNLAVFEALGDIRNQWGRTKSEVLNQIKQNEKLSDEEKHRQV